MKKIDVILKKTLKKVEPNEVELEFMNKTANDFFKKLKTTLKSLKINAEPFIGGSFAKNTIVKKNHYDCDIFLRFQKTDKDISKLTKKILDKTKVKHETIHGSRDYFKIAATTSFCIELIPVKKVDSAILAENITDLSYSHVKYLNKKIKSQKIINDIKLMKAFCYAKNCYGAESYINGFSGYSLELLIYHFKGFENFLKEITKKTKDKIIIDIEKLYKNKSEILIDLNESKQGSPIILIDPTYKERNVTAALSEETFDKFLKAAKKFLKNPSEKDFEIKIENVEKIKENAEKNKHEFIEIQISTEKQTGDIAGTKLKKFYKHLTEELKKLYKLKKSGFSYDDAQTASIYFVADSKKEITLKGPFKDSEKHIKAFKKEHKDAKLKGNRYIAIKKINFTLKEFMNTWKKKNKRKIKEMTISQLRV